MEVIKLFNSFGLFSIISTFLFIQILCFKNRLDFTIFISINFSIVINWIFLTSFDNQLIKFTLIFILIILIFYNIKIPGDRLLLRFLSSFKRDFSKYLILISLCNFFFIMVPSIGLDQLTARELNFEAQSSFAYRILSYFLLPQSILISLVIEKAVNRGVWYRTEKISIIIVFLTSLLSISRTGMLYPAFIYLLCKLSINRKITPVFIFLIFLLSLPVISSHLFPELSYGQYIRMIVSRIINNVDVIYYLELLNTFDYPFSSPFYLAWPFYHTTQANFVVPGAWLFSAVTGNSSGFGPNPTFIIDYILASNLIGLLIAFPLARLLKLSKIKGFPVTGSAITLTLLQDWYLSCTILAVLFLFILGFKLRLRL